MRSMAKLISICVIMFVIFFISGMLANWVFFSTGCLWTSAGVFGISFGGTMLGIMSSLISPWDMWDWF
jgi:hypothetical protein